MTADIDIYRAAKLYIDQHGDQAALQAAMQSDALLDVGDLDGAATWRKIIKAGRPMLRMTSRTMTGNAKMACFSIAGPRAVT